LGDFPVPEKTRSERNAVPALAVQVGIAGRHDAAAPDAGGELP